MKKWAVSFAIVIMTVLLISGCALGAHSPIIHNLTAEQPILLPARSSNIRCTAEGREGDSLSYNLSYNWSASGGSIYGQAGSGGTSVVTWKAPDVAGKYTVTVRVTDSGGNQATGHIVLAVKTNYPIITSLVTNADDNWVKPSGSCRIECQAEDRNGGKLTYAWEASGGRISGTGPVVTWTAPDTAGDYRIAVVVTGSEGGQGKNSLDITVAPNRPAQRPPVIGDLAVIAKEPEYMKGDKIYQGKSCELRCLASDPDGDTLSYTWSAEDGELAGEGSVVIWTAPLDPVFPVPVTVTVSDNWGGTASESKVFNVVTCMCQLQ